MIAAALLPQVWLAVLLPQSSSSSSSSSSLITGFLSPGLWTTNCPQAHSFQSRKDSTAALFLNILNILCNSLLREPECSMRCILKSTIRQDYESVNIRLPFSCVPVTYILILSSNFPLQSSKLPLFKRIPNQNPVYISCNPNVSYMSGSS